MKTTNDLLLLRSDVYSTGDDGRMIKQEAPAPLVDLDPRYYKTIGAFEQRFPAGAPSLSGATRLEVRGDWTFEDGVVVVGDVALADAGEPQTVPAGSTLTGARA